MDDRQFLEQVTKRLADEGRLIEAGWIGFVRIHFVALDASAIQLTEMRLAYMSGAQHLFASITAMLNPGADETPGDMRRLDQINEELGAFAKEMERLGKPREPA